MSDTPNLERELDDIMEDLMVGHNFDYARKALLEWHTQHTDRARVDELMDVARNARVNKKGSSAITVKERIAELKKGKSE